MANAITIELAGKVVPKQSARFFVGKTGKINSYTPAKTVCYAADLRLAAQQVMKGRNPMVGPVILRMWITLPIMPSWTKTKQREAAAGIQRPISKPDLDNYQKAIQDAFNKIVFYDDAQIVEAFTSKRYGDKPGLRVEVEALA